MTELIVIIVANALIFTIGGIAIDRWLARQWRKAERGEL